jgi:dimeric dUTPase (all-alpha-NTP-PPase superfamily)
VSPDSTLIIISRYLVWRPTFESYIEFHDIFFPFIAEFQICRLYPKLSSWITNMMQPSLFTQLTPHTNLMDKLDTIFSIQKELTSMMDLSRYPPTVDGKVSALSTAIIHEAIELQRLTNWKWWKRPTPFDSEAAKEELIDIWHFVIQASIELGMTPCDVVNEYRKKNKLNRNRQASGY